MVKKPLVDVIGGSGFIGSHLCKILSEHNYDFQILDIAKPQKTEHGAHHNYCDITRIQDLRKFLRPNSTVVNLAAIHSDDITDSNSYYSVNVEGSKKLVTVCGEKSISRIIYTSSIAVYDLTTPIVNEDSAKNPLSHYGRSKLMSEEFYLDWAREGENRTLLIIRPCAVFGPGNRGNVFNLAKTIAANRFVMIGNGLNKKSLCYVEHIAEFIFSQVTGDIHSETAIAIKNYADKPDLSVKQIVTNMYVGLNKKPKYLQVSPKIALITAQILDIAEKLIGFKNPYSAERIIKFTAQSTVGSYHDLTDAGASDLLSKNIQKFVASEFQR